MCKKLKEYLRSAAIEYEEADMSTPEALTELRVNGVFTMVAPVLQVGDTFLTLGEIFEDEMIRKDVIDDLVGRRSS